MPQHAQENKFNFSMLGEKRPASPPALMCQVYVPVAKNHREFIRYHGAKTLGQSHKDWGQSMVGEELDLVKDALDVVLYGTNEFHHVHIIWCFRG